MNSVWPKKGIPWLPYERFSYMQPPWWEYICIVIYEGKGSSCRINCLWSSSENKLTHIFGEIQHLATRMRALCAPLLCKRENGLKTENLRMFYEKIRDNYPFYFLQQKNIKLSPSASWFFLLNWDLLRGYSL